MGESIFLFLSFVISGKCQWLSQCQSRLGTRIDFQKPSCLVLTIWIHVCTVCLFVGSFITLLPVFPLKNFRTYCLTTGLPFVSSLDCVAISRVADLCSLILRFWHLIDADNANCRYCCSLGSVCSIWLFSWILRGTRFVTLLISIFHCFLLFLWQTLWQAGKKCIAIFSTM